MTEFESWLEAVDTWFLRIVGMDRDSWPDQDYWSMFEDGYTPVQALMEAIESEYGQEALEAFGFEMA